DLEAGAHDVFAYGVGADGEPRAIGLQFDVPATPSTPDNPTTGGDSAGTASSTGSGTTGGGTAATSGGSSPLATTGFGAALPSMLAAALVIGGGLIMITVARSRRQA
ncbi:MAG: hypothetical protein KDB24_18130, partial [Microthrixaceae bacterium]|nr:hypothetical protein [Microthrixaceae bacterium]